MPTKDVFATARELGEIVAKGRATWPRLALEAAGAAERGEIDEDDAAHLYETYIKRAMCLNHVDFSSNTIKANVSKLRQIIKCGTNGTHASALLRRVEVIHARSRVPVKPLYQAMVDVCRLCARSKHKLTKEQIIKTIAA